MHREIRRHIHQLNIVHCQKKMLRSCGTFVWILKLGVVNSNMLFGVCDGGGCVSTNFLSDQTSTNNFGYNEEFYLP